MLQQNAPRRIGPLETAQQKDALQPQGDRHDRRKQVELGTVLVDPQLRSRLVSINMTRIWPELRKPRSHCASNPEVRQHPRNRRPNPPVRGCLWCWGRNGLRIGELLAPRIDLLPCIPSPPERLRCAAIRNHHLHRQAARGCRVTQRRRRQYSLYRRKKLDILLQCQSSHQDRARVDLLMRRLRRKLGKEIHRTHEVILLQKRIKGENSFSQLRQSSGSGIGAVLGMQVSLRPPTNTVIPTEAKRSGGTCSCLSFPTAKHVTSTSATTLPQQ